MITYTIHIPYGVLIVLGILSVYTFGFFMGICCERSREDKATQESEASK